MGLKKIIDLDLLDRFLTKVKELIPTKTSDLENDSGYMSGMTILSYGSSTWNDFIEAYEDNKVVYCRASSNSNPASGSQTRMAFMAYVNDQTTPTEVEFQYYRSVNSHTVAQQGDQVFVYKLNKNSGWSVTTRNAFSKVVAGTGLSSNYASGTITLNSSYESKAAESGGTDLSLVTTGEKAIWNAASSDQSVMLVTFTKISSTSLTPDVSYSDAMTAIQAGTILFAKLNDDGTHDNIYRLNEYVARSSVVVNVPYIEFSLVTMEQIGYSRVKKKRIRWNSTSPNSAILYTDEQSQTKFGCVHLVDENDGICSYQDPPTGTLRISPNLDYLSDISELYNLAWGQAVNNYSGILLINGNPQNGQLPFEIYECSKAEWDHSETDVEEITLTFTSIGYRNNALIFKTITVIGAPYTYDWQSYSVTYSEIPASGSSYESKEPVSGGTDVSLVTTGEKYTWNAKGNGTITGITMNGASKGTSGVVNLGTVITEHQDISGKADKSATVSNVAYDSTNKKITKTINGTASDVVTVATLKSAMSLSKSDVDLGNVENKSSATIRGELTKANVTTALGYTPPTTDTTYESKAAASGGTDVSLVTTGEKYTWNAKGNGTITGITMNGASKGTSGVVNLGTVITSHQDISGKADKSATVSNVAYDPTNKKITKTINGTTSDVVSAATLKTDMALAKGDVGLGNVDNVKQYSASNPPPYPVTSVNGDTGAVTVSVPSAGTATPKMDGTAAVGSSAKYAKEDHVHPVDTSRAPASHTHDTDDITSGTLPVSRGGTGETTARDAANAFINSLNAANNSNVPVDDDYFISQYIGGGTTTTTYYRRPLSNLWEYIKSKLNSTVALLSGGTAIASSTDLDTLTGVGNYYCKSSSIAASLSHCPVSKWFYMRVSLNTGTNTAYPCQEITRGTDGTRYYRYNNNGSRWSDWIEYAPNTDTTYSAGDGLIQNGTTFSDHRGIEYIRGTWTADSGTWTGVSTDTELYDGKQIILYMPFAGSGNATLNLTLAGGGTTGAKNVYYENTTRFTTHKSANSQLHLIYHDALTLSNGNTYQGWWYVANRYTSYSNRAAAEDGTQTSLVTTGEKFTWNNKQDSIEASGVLKGDGSGTVSAATKGTDYGALSFTVSLTVAGWSSNAQTITNSNFVTSGYAYIVTPASGSYAAYAAAQIYADDVTTASKMKFHCVSKPSTALTVNVLRVVSA